MTNASARLNRFLERSQPSATYRVIDRIAEKRELGETVISLCAGEPDFDTPAHISAAAIEAIRCGSTRYTQVAGLKALRQAVAKKFQEENDIPTTWDETIVCTGGKQVLFNALAATLNENDEVSGDKGNAFKLTPEALVDAITPQTKWLILNSPSNPTGAVYSKDELLKLAEVLRKHADVMVLSDDIYEHLIFDGLSFNTMAQAAPDLKDRILTMNGVSKAYAMTGWRIGFATGPKWLIGAMTKLHTSKSVFIRRRDTVVKMVNDAPGLSCDTPSGAFYIFADCTGLLDKTTPNGKLLETDEDVANALLEEMNVAVVHGRAFGMGPYLRIAYALDDESLRLACSNKQTFC
jgi:aspartate aminotransferase